MANDLDEAEVKKLVDDWYHALDVHAPVDEVVPMVAADGSSATGRRVRPTASTSSRAGTTRSPTSSSTKSTR